jgi:hypothetical protein
MGSRVGVECPADRIADFDGRGRRGILGNKPPAHSDRGALSVGMKGKRKERQKCKHYRPGLVRENRKGVRCTSILAGEEPEGSKDEQQEKKKRR